MIQLIIPHIVVIHKLSKNTFSIVYIHRAMHKKYKKIIFDTIRCNI